MDYREDYERGRRYRDEGDWGDRREHERRALGAPQFNPAPLFNQQRANTAEIYQPPSVTENTRISTSPAIAVSRTGSSALRGIHPDDAHKHRIPGAGHLLTKYRRS